MPGPINEHGATYFPSLDRLLSNVDRLLSWQCALSALSNPEALKNNDQFRQFLNDDLTISTLAQASESKLPSTKEDFETRTAAINANSPRNERYDIEKIKADALWLAENAGIDEVSALRVVVLELQDCPALNILQRYTEEEKISLRQAVGDADFGSAQSAPYTGLSATRDDAKSFDAMYTRRARLFRLSLLERESMLGFKVIVAALELQSPQPPWGRTYGETPSRNTPMPLLQDLAKRVSHRERRGSRGKGAEGVGASDGKETGAGNFVYKMVGEVVARLQACERERNWTLEEAAELEELDRTSQFSQIASVLQLLFIRLSSSIEPESAASVKSWFNFVDDLAFLASLSLSSPQQAAVAGEIRVLVSIISLQIIKLPQTMAYIRTRQLDLQNVAPFILDSDCQRVVSISLLHAAEHGILTASPAMLAWSILLQQLRIETSLLKQDNDSEDDMSPAEVRHEVPSRPTDTIQKLMEDALKVIMDLPLDEDPILYLARTAVNSCQVFSVVANVSQLLRGIFDRTLLSTTLLHGSVTLLELIRESLAVVAYSPEVLEVSLTILSGPVSHSGQAQSQFKSVQEELGSVFVMDDDVMMAKLFSVAQQRYPYEFAPYLKFSKALSAAQTFDADGRSTLPHLLEVSNCSQKLPKDFTAYELVREDENANRIRLIEDLPLFAMKKGRGFGISAEPVSSSLALKDLYCIPRGTTGFVMNDQKPFVVMWEHPHSALRYLSQLLSTAPITSSLVIVGELDTPASDLQADIIELIAIRLSSTLAETTSGLSKAERIAAAHRILEEASDSLGRNEDIVTLVATIFEEEVSRLSQQRNEGTTELLVSCVHFMRAITEVLPSRIWPLLARSDFLQADGNDPKLAFIVASTEIPIGRFDLLLSTLSLFDALVEDVLTNAVQRRAPKTTNGRRFGDANSSNSGLSEKVLSKVISTLTRIFLDVLQSSQQWTFAIGTQKIEMSNTILQIFEKIILNVYGFDDTKDITKKITSALAPAAKHLVDAFIGGASAATPLRAALQTCINCTSININWTLTQPSQTNLRPTQIPLRFLTTLLHITTAIDTPSAQFEQQIFRFLPVVIRIYAADQLSRHDVLLLLTALVDCAARTTTEPPSLLSQLGQENSKNFLSIISDTNLTSAGDEELATKIWNLCTSIVSGRQQWFATYLLTGDTPSSTMKTKATDQAKTGSKPMLTVALDSLASIRAAGNKIQQTRTIAELRFIAAAQGQWAWVTDTIRKHPSFIKNVAEFVDKMETGTAELTGSNGADHILTASLIADVLAIFLYNSRHMGDVSNVKTVASHLTFFKEQGVAVPKYLSSLHTHLKKNFSQKFPGCEVDQFRRVTGPLTFGSDYYYGMEFASKLLGVRFAEGSFADEFSRANTNLSLVQSQVLLLNSWKTLAIELSASLAQETSLQKQLATVARECLVANAESNLPEIIFDQLLMKRADLALIIVQRLVTARSNTPHVKFLLDTAWSTIRTCGHDLDSAFSGPTTEYYRALLKILLLTIQFHTFASSQPTPTSTNRPTTTDQQLPPQTASILLEITTQIIAKGFCSLATQLHEDPTTVLPSDISLLIALLQSIMRIPTITHLHSQLALRLSDSNCTRYAIALFSWSDRITADEDDPVYGHLAISFLTETSNIPSMAEFLAAEGLLAQLASANLMSYYKQQGGIGPLDNPQRLHTTWAKGFLPLVLNMLVSVGASFAAEATSFLNSFPEQLARSAESLDFLKNKANAGNGRGQGRGHIVLSSAAETHNLALLTMILERFRQDPLAAAAAATAGGEVPPLQWDWAAVKGDLESVLSSSRRGTLRERITPVSEAEVGLSRLGPSVDESPGCENRLEERVVRELEGAGRCLGVLG